VALQEAFLRKFKSPSSCDREFGIRAMVASDLSDLIAGANEDLGIEFKAWPDTGGRATRVRDIVPTSAGSRERRAR